MIINTAKRLGETKEYYFSVKLREVRELIAQGKDVINMGIGNPDLKPSEQTITALTAAAHKENAHGYQPYKGVPELREAMAKWYKKVYQVEMDPASEILPLIGSKEGITHISLAFLDEGDEVLVPELGYPAYRSVSTMLGAKIVEYPLLEKNNWQPDWETMYATSYPNAKIMWLNYPHMPTGTTASKKLFEKAIKFAHEKRLLICHDNPYSLILNRQAPLSIFSVEGAKEVCLELNSMSKSHNMAGWRVGWLNGRQDYIDAVLKIKSNVDSGMFLGIQKAAISALESPMEWHEDQNTIYEQRQQIVYQILDKLECQYSAGQAGMFVWAKLPKVISSAEKLIDHLLYNYHMFIAPGFIFGPKGDRYIRISLCTSQERLEEALKRIQDINVQQL
ncbi:aminotransferase class I/II-fold pyridoxal phosphate-dependent enzyme [Rapidithrix thailandica]|uniref:Aminotransferase n=1 Tax=Rapidithrix thailandica TaxID=413964 RepID=A0AAW9S854_9BACT